MCTRVVHYGPSFLIQCQIMVKKGSILGFLGMPDAMVQSNEPRNVSSSCCEQFFLHGVCDYPASDF